MSSSELNVLPDEQKHFCSLRQQAFTSVTVDMSCCTKQLLAWNRHGRRAQEASCHTRHLWVETRVVSPPDGRRLRQRYVRLRQVQSNLLFSLVGDSSCLATLGTTCRQAMWHLHHARQLYCFRGRPPTCLLKQVGLWSVFAAQLRVGGGRHCIGMLLSIVPIYTADGQAPAADWWQCEIAIIHRAAHC